MPAGISTDFLLIATNNSGKKVELLCCRHFFSHCNAFSTLRNGIIPPKSCRPDYISIGMNCLGAADLPLQFLLDLLGGGWWC